MKWLNKNNRPPQLQRQARMRHLPRPPAPSWCAPCMDRLSAWEDELRGDNCSCFTTGKGPAREWNYQKRACEKWDNVMSEMCDKKVKCVSATRQTLLTHFPLIHPLEPHLSWGHPPMIQAVSGTVQLHRSALQKKNNHQALMDDLPEKYIVLYIYYPHFLPVLWSLQAWKKK